MAAWFLKVGGELNPLSAILIMLQSQSVQKQCGGCNPSLFFPQPFVHWQDLKEELFLEQQNGKSPKEA